MFLFPNLLFMKYKTSLCTWKLLFSTITAKFPFCQITFSIVIWVRMQQSWVEWESPLAMVVRRDTRLDPRMAPAKVEEAKNLGCTWTSSLQCYAKLSKRLNWITLEELAWDGNQTISEQTCHCKSKTVQMKITAWNRCSWHGSAPITFWDQGEAIWLFNDRTFW